MVRFVIIFVSVILCLFQFVHSKQIPPYITLCHKQEEDFNGCILRAIEQVRPHLMNGIPELFVPSLNPLRVTRIELNSGDSFRSSFENLEIYNAYNFRINRLNADLDKNHLELDLYFPYLRINSVYNMKGRILYLEIEGKGHSSGNYSDVYSNTTVQGEREIRNGREYIRFAETDLKLKIGGAYLYFDDLFNGDKELTRQINMALNNNMEDLIVELNPVIHDAVSKIIFGFLAEIFYRIPVDTFFPS